MNLVTGLKVYLATNFALYLKTHNAHWNVTGMFFPQLHSMFGDQYQDLFDQVDLIAEKIRELDAFAPGGLLEYKNLSLIDDLTGVLDAKGYLERLLKDHERMIVFLNKLFAIAQDENNQAVMNYIADRLDVHAKTRWQLRTMVNPVGGMLSAI